MKIPCDVIKDLLLLYENGEASEETVKIVEEHMAECDCCRTLLNHADEDRIIDGALSEAEKEEVVAVKEGLGKVKRRWKLSIISVLMIIPVVCIGILAFHQITGRGVAFTNIDEILLAKKFMSYIEDENYEAATAMLDYTEDYESVIDTLSQGEPRLEELYGKNPTKEEYTQKRNEILLEWLDDFKQGQYKISDIKYNQVYLVKGDENRWQVYISFIEAAPDGDTQMVIADFSCSNGNIVYHGAMEAERLSAFDYAMNFNNLWNLEETPSYEEYLQMEEK